MAKPDPQSIFQSLLAAAQTDWRVWPQLAWELHRSDEDSEITSANPDPTTGQRWQKSDADRRDQIVDCARHFLLHGEPSTTAEAKRNFELPVFWALWLVKGKFESDMELRNAVTTKWFAGLFTQPFIHVPEERELTRIGV